MTRPALPRRVRSAPAAAALLLAAACGASEAPAPASAGGAARHVVLISLDSVRADALSFRDAAAAPHLARLAERGTVFTQAVAGSSWTLPTHVQMLTGQAPSLSRVEVDSVRIDAGTPLVTERLRAAGFATLGFWTGWYLAPSYGFDRGFVLYRNAMTDGERRARELEELLEGQAVGDAIETSGRMELDSHKDVTSANLAGQALQALAGVGADERVFLFAHLFDPHYDYVPPGTWATRFDPDYAGAIDGRDYWSNPAIWDPQRNARACSDRDVEHLRALYRGEIGWVDENLGRVLDGLERDGRLDDALIIVTSDHGEEFFEHGGRGHRNSLYDEVLRVPLLVVPPEALRAGAPREVDAQVSLSDVMPTILDYVGLPPPAGVDGRSLRPALEGRAFESRPVVASLQVQSTGPDGRPALLLHEAVRTPDEKLLRVTTITPGKRQQVVGLALFDLRADPGERSPLPGQPQQLLQGNARMRAAWQRLEQGLDELRRLAGERPRQPVAERTTDVARALERELRQLGYVDAGAGESNAAGFLPDWGLDVRPALPLQR